MKNILSKILLALIFVFALCLAGCNDGSTNENSTDITSSSPSEFFGGYSGGGSGNNNGNGNPTEPGIITAGEWNDLSNWSFWENVINSDDYKSMPEYWSFYSNHRISVAVTDNNSRPVANAKVTLTNRGNAICTVRTDNSGHAELWTGLFQNSANIDYSALRLIANDVESKQPVKPYSEGINQITIPSRNAGNRIEIAFMVDATGSMCDELEYLKTELIDVTGRVKNGNSDISIYTSAVFYRDEGDEYITKISNFTDDIYTTINFINLQNADGGGDFPEAVHTALEKSVNELQWTNNSKTRLLFILLDAPPHYDNAIINSLHISITKAMEKGIKIIPITASGIDKETEFLMRFIAIATNGTYVFITDHSGVGNEHLKPTIGEYQVEKLNDLMVHLINKYVQ
jgi:hypothetical protein